MSSVIGHRCTNARENDSGFSTDVHELFVKVETRFVDDLPLVRLVCQVSGKLVSRLFLLDSGANRSALFVDGRHLTKKQVGTDIAWRIGIDRSGASLGYETFFVLEWSYVAPGFRGWLQSNKVDGLLGVDFLRSHDVLIDYKSSKLYLSQKIDGQTTEGSKKESANIEASGRSGVKYDLAEFDRATLFEFDNRFCAAVTVQESDRQNMIFLPLDTGSSLIVFASSILPESLRPVRFDTEVYGGESNLRSTTRDLLIAPTWTQSQVRLNASITDGGRSVLACRPFGERVFLSFRNNAAYFWPSRKK